MSEQATKIQKWFRGSIFRKRIMPIVMYALQKHLRFVSFHFSNQSQDGRINSIIDEHTCIKSLVKKFKNRIQVPKIRMWYDILAYDYRHGWIPINIKTTTTTSRDNIGNLTTCVYAYTNESIDLHKKYENGRMSMVLFDKIKSREYNYSKRDYYFIILNKYDQSDVIINSLKGLTSLSPNINNLPFQVKWNKNRIYTYRHIHLTVQQFIECLKKPKPSWQETFLCKIRNDLKH